MSCFPECYDILFHSGHHKKIIRLSWYRINAMEFLNYVLKNEYLVMTQSCFHPSYTNTHNDLLKFDRNEYADTTKEYYLLVSTTELSGGGITKIRKRKW